MSGGLNNQTKLIIAAVAVIILAGIVWYVWLRPKPEPIKTAEDAIEAISAAPTVGEVTSNPAEKLPELNPIRKANPFKDVYKNPFE